MRIGLVDVDGNNFPNIPLMKISAWHKAKGDTVEWHQPLSGHYDKVYCSKVFSFSPDYEWDIDADEISWGGADMLYPMSTAERFMIPQRILPCHMR